MRAIKDMSPPGRWAEAIPMTTAEISELLGVDRSTVLRRLSDTEPVVQLKRMRRYRPRDVARAFFGEDYAARVFDSAPGTPT